MNFVDQGGNEIVGVFEGVADIMEPLDKETGALIDIMRGAIELAGDGLAFRYVTNELIVHKTIYDLTIYDVRLMYDLVI